MAGGKSNWNDDPIKKNGVICGRKTFDISDSSERRLCANELLCRQFLKDKKSTFITNLVVIEPESVQALLDEIDTDKVRCDFWGERDRLDKALRTVSGNVTLFIELGTSDTKALFKDYALDYSHHEAEILSIIRRLFEMVSVMQKIGFVNTDIKADNLIYSERDNEPSLIMNDFDTSFILNTDKGIRFKAIDKHPFTEPAPELVGWHTENRVGNWTDMFIAGILAYRLLNNFDYPEAFFNAKTSISDITERYFEYQRLFNSLGEGESTIEPPANGSDELKSVILAALRVTPEERPNASDVLEVLDCAAEKTKEYCGSTLSSDISEDNAEVIPVETVKKRSWLSFVLFAIPVTAFVGIISFVLLNQLQRETYTGDVSEPPYVVSGQTTVTDKKTELPSAAISETFSSQTATEAINTEPATKKATEKTTSTTAKANIGKGSEVSQSEHITVPEDVPEPPIEPVEEYTEAVTETPTEASSPFSYAIKEIDGQGIFTNVTGIEINGYNNVGEIPAVLEIPEAIDGTKVVSIAADAFSGCDIEEVIIPDSVVNICDRAFCNCPVLWKATLGKNVAMIGEQAFFNIQYIGTNQREINISNPRHSNCERFFGDQWDGREHDYTFVFNY